MNYRMRIANRTGLSIYNIARVITPEEKELYNIRYNLGLLETAYDSMKSSSDFIPSMYNTYGEYSLDIEIANRLLMENKEIPKELEQRLISARKEMQEKGLYIK